MINDTLRPYKTLSALDTGNFSCSIIEFIHPLPKKFCVKCSCGYSSFPQDTLEEVTQTYGRHIAVKRLKNT